jgi:2-polyprenyl-6-methoxyphenol hydroxylase-like FAD-dependent oxidoreductase
VIEQNPAGATYGWGVVFSERALGFLAEADPESYRDLEARLEVWSDQAIVHRGEAVRIDGPRLLRHRAPAPSRHPPGALPPARRGPRARSRCEDPGALAGADLLVGADGAAASCASATATRSSPTSQRSPTDTSGTAPRRPFDCLTLTFRDTPHGFFVAHHYRHAPAASTFVVECDADTWSRAGFEAMSEEAARRYCEGVFAPDLAGHSLLSNRSAWLRFRLVTNRRWHH